MLGYSAEEMLGNPHALEWLLPDAQYRHKILAERRVRPTYRNWEWRMHTKESAEKIIAWHSTGLFRFPNTETSWWQIGVDMSTITHAQHTIKHQLTHTQAQTAVVHSVLEGLAALHTETKLTAQMRVLDKTLRPLIPYENIRLLLVEHGMLQQAFIAEHAPEGEAVTPASMPLAPRQFPVLHALMQSSNPVLLPDVEESEQWQSNPPFHHVRAWMGAPLSVGEYLIGILCLESTQPHTFEESHLPSLALFSHIIAQNIHNHRLQRETRAALEREQLLNEAMQRLSSALDRPLILQTGAHLACDLFQAHAACFVLRNEQGKWYVAYQRNLPPLPYPENTLPQQDLLQRVASTNTSLLVYRYSEHPAANPAWVKAGITTCMGAPLSGESGALGCIYLFRIGDDTPFSMQDLNLLERLGWQLGTILQNALLFADERQRADELGALRDTLADLSAQLAMPDLMYAILERAVALLLAHGGELGLYDHERGGLHVVASYNMGNTFVGQFIPTGRGVMGTVLQSGELLMLDDYHAWENSLPTYRSSICRSVIAAPLKARGRLLGVISIVDARPGRRFAENEIRILKTFAQQAAVAVDNVQLFEAAHLRAEEAETLREVSLVVSGLLEEEEAIRHILELVGRVITCDSAVVVLQEDNALRIAGEHHWQEHPSMQGMLFDRFSLTPYAQVARTHAPLRIADVSTCYPALTRDERARHIRAWLGVPLGKPERPLGVLAIHSALPNYFTTTHERLMTAFASHVTVAITNARLYQEAQYLAVTDPLTTLYNRRYFFQIALREFERAVRHGYPLSILMIDIDFFKSVNDTYGHQAGDEVLRNVARACQESVREIDLLARYGGEEFIALLPDTHAEGALDVAQRLHQCIEKLRVDYEGQEICVTVSVGVAPLQENISSLDVLIAHADAALYHAKQTGRNRVACWKAGT